MTIYKTVDGKTFKDIEKAVIHTQILQYKNQGFDVVGKPYEYYPIEHIKAEG